MTSRSCVRVVVELEIGPPSRSVGEAIVVAGPRACGRGGGGGADNGGQVFTTSMLTVCSSAYKFNRCVNSGLSPCNGP